MKCKMCKSTRIVRLEVVESIHIKEKYKFDVARFFQQEKFDLLKCLDCDLKFFNKVVSGDSLFYDLLQENEFYYEKEKAEFDFALSKIAHLNPKKILEIGAGKGCFVEKIKDYYDVRVSEFSKKSIDFLEKNNVTFDSSNDTYDFICAFQVLEHVERLDIFLEFIDSKLEDNGYLLLSVPNNDSEYFKNVFDALDYPPHHMYQFSRKALHSIGVKLHYSVEDYWTEPLRIEHYFSIIKSKRLKLMKAHPIKRNFFSLFDYLLAPYFYDKSQIGHTHAILFQKITKK
ncbi:class I SAM-dependent methyltransferase [Sulfurospirillum sp. T05]|uniref:Class I SAM-dependent methyltransferase n=1 Tax=Sulfurospirillum tamanense TaxID=2813362 RepID=A0ABS2WS86_9BACT|nr:class I SAM-dependent methyltransferase [Sulfurospirillum tamanensis]MBN2964468.1 class I SAM-dependent methyltransferase [Sulfurospirillum tamanensis]